MSDHLGACTEESLYNPPRKCLQSKTPKGDTLETESRCPLSPEWTPAKIKPAGEDNTRGIRKVPLKSSALVTISRHVSTDHSKVIGRLEPEARGHMDINKVHCMQEAHTSPRVMLLLPL